MNAKTGITYYVWRRSDGHVDVNAGGMPRDYPGSSFEQLLETSDWVEARTRIETERASASASAAAEALMTEYNRCCRTGDLMGGVLAYDAGGAGEWFPAGTRLGTGTFGLPVAFKASLSRKAAEQMIRDAASGVGPEGDEVQ